MHISTDFFQSLRARRCVFDGTPDDDVKRYHRIKVHTVLMRTTTYYYVVEVLVYEVHL
jgi:hypothetical protein